MIVRRVSLAFVSSVLFAALVANPGSSLASTNVAANLSTQAYAALSGGDAAKSLVLYSQAIESGELGPDALANALLNRALAFQQTQQNEKAITDYTAALTLDVMSSALRATALYNRGLAQQKSKQVPLAIEDFTSALLINPEFSHAYLARANALRESGQYLFALSDYERALKYNHPEQARVYFGEAQTYEYLKRPIDAKRFLKAALVVDAGFKPAIEKLKTLGELAEADDSGTDPILTGSTVANLGGSTEVIKPELPKGVEPPASLMAEAQAPTDAPVYADATKAITDRLPAVVVDSQVADAAPTETPEAAEQVQKDKKVDVASVPSIPAQSKSSAANEAVGSITPVGKKIRAVKAEQASLKAEEPTLAVETGWSVQIASAASEDAAWTSWKTMQKRFKVLSGQKPVVVKADLGGKGTFYRLRLAGFENQAKAQSACGKLKSGGVSCYISKV